MVGDNHLIINDENIQEICEKAEAVSRRYVLSKIPKNKITNLDISIETNGLIPLTFDIEINVTLTPDLRSFDANKLAKEAMNRAFFCVEEYLRKLKCK